MHQFRYTDKDGNAVPRKSAIFAESRLLRSLSEVASSSFKPAMRNAVTTIHGTNHVTDFSPCVLHLEAAYFNPRCIGIRGVLNDNHALYDVVTLRDLKKLVADSRAQGRELCKGRIEKMGRFIGSRLYHEKMKFSLFPHNQPVTTVNALGFEYKSESPYDCARFLFTVCDVVGDLISMVEADISEPNEYPAHIEHHEHMYFVVRRASNHYRDTAYYSYDAEEMAQTAGMFVAHGVQWDEEMQRHDITFVSMAHFRAFLEENGRCVVKDKSDSKEDIGNATLIIYDDYLE